MIAELLRCLYVRVNRSSAITRSPGRPDLFADVANQRVYYVCFGGLYVEMLSASNCHG